MSLGTTSKARALEECIVLNESQKIKDNAYNPRYLSLKAPNLPTKNPTYLFEA
jgi:hypothetical protein